MMPLRFLSRYSLGGQMRIVLSLLLFATSALGAANDYVLVVNKSSNSLSFVNIDARKTEISLPVGTQPHELGIHPNQQKVYVSNVGSNSLSVVDLKSRKETKQIASPDFQFPHGIVFTLDGKQAIVTSERSHKIVIIDAERDQIVRAIDTDQGGTHMVVLSPDGLWAYFTNRDSNTVSVMDVNRMKIVANIPAGRGVEGIAISPDGNQIWVGDRRDNTVTVIDTSERKAVATLPSGPSPKRVAFSPDGQLVFVPTASDEVYVYEVATRQEIHRIPVGANPGGVIISPDGKQAFVACGDANEVNVIDTMTMTVVAKVAVEGGPDGIGFWTER